MTEKKPRKPKNMPTIHASDGSIVVVGNISGDGIIVGNQNNVNAAVRAVETPLPIYSSAEAIPLPSGLPAGSRIPHKPNELFTGRVEMFKQLAESLCSPLLAGEGLGVRSVVINQAVTGMGGIGKTQLAVEFAYRYGGYFRGAHWLNLAEPSLFESEIADCDRKMFPNANFPADNLPAQVEITLQAWKADGPRLVILDNFEDPAAANAVLAQLYHPNIRVLITSRRADWLPTTGARPIPLDVFSPTESLDFLKRALDKRKDSDADLNTLAERLGRLPLGLELASRYLNGHPRLSVSAYLAQAQAALEHPSMKSWRKEMLGLTATRHDIDLMNTFALSWKELFNTKDTTLAPARSAGEGTKENQNAQAAVPGGEDAAQNMFLCAGYLAPNAPIPLEIFEGALQKITQSETSKNKFAQITSTIKNLFSKQKPVTLQKPDIDEALQDLYGLGLLKQETSGLPSIHPLLADYARILGRENDPLLETLADIVATLANKANETGIPADFNSIKPHVPALAEFAEAANLEDARVLWNNYGYHLWMIANYAGAREMFMRTLKIDEANFGTDHLNVATDVNYLAGVYYALGDLNGARAAFERAIKIWEVNLGAEHPLVATGVNNLGGVLEALGDLNGARTAFEHVLVILEKTLPPNHPYVAATTNNLGMVMRSLGDLNGARAMFERALKINEANFGAEHPQSVAAVNNLGMVMQALGDLSGARAMYERALKIDEANFGAEHPDVARAVNNLGSVLEDLGDLNGARAMYERALKIDEANFGAEHPQVVAAVNNLGSVMKSLGDLNGARAMLERALKILEKQLGENHPNVAILVNNLGSVMQDLGDLNGARAAYERALAIFKKFLPPDHPNIKVVQGHLDSLPSTNEDHHE